MAQQSRFRVDTIQLCDELPVAALMELVNEIYRLEDVAGEDVLAAIILVAIGLFLAWLTRRWSRPTS